MHSILNRQDILKYLFKHASPDYLGEIEQLMDLGDIPLVECTPNMIQDLPGEVLNKKVEWLRRFHPDLKQYLQQSNATFTYKFLLEQLMKKGFSFRKNQTVKIHYRERNREQLEKIKQMGNEEYNNWIKEYKINKYSTTSATFIDYETKKRFGETRYQKFDYPSSGIGKIRPIFNTIDNTQLKTFRSHFKVVEIARALELDPSALSTYLQERWGGKLKSSYDPTLPKTFHKDILEKIKAYTEKKQNEKHSSKRRPPTTLSQLSQAFFTPQNSNHLTEDKTESKQSECPWRLKKKIKLNPEIEYPESEYDSEEGPEGQENNKSICF